MTLIMNCLILTSLTSHMEEIWQFQHAKAKLSEVVRKAQHAPQVITVHDEKKAVVISSEEYDRLKGRTKKQSFVEFMRSSPWMGIELDLERDQSPPRDIDL